MYHKCINAPNASKDTLAKDRYAITVMLNMQENGDLKIEKEPGRLCVITKREILKKCVKIGEGFRLEKITKSPWNNMNPCFQDKMDVVQFVEAQSLEGLAV